MERKKGAVLRSSRSIPRHERPRIAVAPRVYMDIMSPNNRRSAERPTANIPISQPAVQPVPSFDMKPLAAPSKAVPHTASALRPISKTLVSVAPAPQQPVQPSVEPGEIIVSEPEIPASVVKPDFEQPTKPSVAIKKRKHLSLHKKPAKRHIPHGVAVILFIAGVYVAADGWLTNQSVQQQASVLGARIQRETPAVASVERNVTTVLSERLPSGIGSYSVEPDLPRVLHIPLLKVVSPVLPVGVKANSSLTATKNIYETGWYKASAKPTDKEGAILINGHVNGPTKHGAFYSLKDLKGGDEIVMERGDRRMMTFVVKRVESVETDKVSMATLLKSVEPAKLGLNLITSEDEKDADKPRIIVYAVQK